MSDGRDTQAVERALAAHVGDEILLDVSADHSSIARVVGTSWIERPEAPVTALQIALIVGPLGLAFAAMRSAARGLRRRTA
ncbi:MAG: hypothetical protein ACHREM_04360 [Polyangiales bacterium]